MPRGPEIKTKIETNRPPDADRPNKNLFAEFSSRPFGGETSRSMKIGDSKTPESKAIDPSIWWGNDVRMTLALINPLYEGRYFLGPSGSSERSPAQLLKEGDKKLNTNLKIFGTARSIFKEINRTVSELESQIKELCVAPTTNKETNSNQTSPAEWRTTKLNNIVGRLDRREEIILENVKELSSIKQLIEDYYVLQSKLEKIDNDGLKKNYPGIVDKYYKLWRKNKPNQGKLLEQAISLLGNIDATRESAQEAFQMAVEEDLQISHNIMPSRQIGESLIKGRTKLQENLATLTAADSTIKEIDGAVNKLEMQVGEATSDQINSAARRIAELEGMRGMFYQAKESIVQEINSLFSMRSPLKDYPGLRSEITKMRDTDLRNDYLDSIDKYYNEWQKNKPNQEKLLKQAISLMGNIDANMERIQKALYEKPSSSSDQPQPQQEQVERLLETAFTKLWENQTTFAIIKGRFDKLPGRVDELVREVRIAATTNGETELKDTVEYLDELKKNILDHVDRILSISSPIENYYELRSEIEKIPVDTSKENYRDWVDAYYNEWRESKPDQEELLGQAIAGIVKVEEGRNIAKQALHEAMRANAHPNDEMIPYFMLEGELEHGRTKLEENQGKFLAVNGSFNGIDQTIDDLVSQIKEYPAIPEIDGDSTIGQIEFAEKRKTDFEGILEKLLQERNNLTAEIKDLFSVRFPIDYYGLRSEIGMITDDTERKTNLNTIDEYHDIWRQYLAPDRSTLIMQAIPRIGKIDENIEIAEQALHEAIVEYNNLKRNEIYII